MACDRKRQVRQYIKKIPEMLARKQELENREESAGSGTGERQTRLHITQGEYRPEGRTAMQASPANGLNLPSSGRL